MAYRDERDALKAKVEDLERDLAGAGETIARLKGERAAEAVAADEPSWFVGAPTRLVTERELPFEVSDEGYEAIAELARTRMPTLGPSTQVGRTLSCGPAGRQLRVARTGGGRTELRVEGDWRSWRVLLGLVLPGATLFGLLPVVAALKALALSPLSLVVALPLTVLACWRLIRALVARYIKNDRRALTGLLEAAAELAERHQKSRGVRIDEAGATPAEPARESEGDEAATDAQAHDEAALGDAAIAERRTRD